jgi:hypothetical protein
VSDNDFQAELKACQRVFQEKGSEGLTSRELMRHPAFTRLRGHLLKDILMRLVSGQQIQHGRASKPGAATRNRQAWVWRGEQGEAWTEEADEQTQSELVGLLKRLGLT